MDLAPTTPPLVLYKPAIGGEAAPTLLEIVQAPGPTLDRVAAQALARDPEGVLGMVPIGADAPAPDLISRWGADRDGEPAVVCRLWQHHRRPPESGCGLCPTCTAVDVGYGMVMCVRERWEEGATPAEHGPGTTPPHWVVPLGDAAPAPHWLYLFGCDRPGEPWYAVRAWKSHLLPADGCGLCPTCRAATTSAGVRSCVVAYRVGSPGPTA
jgi:hypothetical protein